jgi:hypothetical protein
VLTQLRKTGVIVLPTPDEARIADRGRLEDIAEAG